MEPDSGEPDAAALRDRVAQLEQTVADQQQTIESLSSPPASRRGVLAALTGVAGAGALGAYSQRASAQAAGQVGTQSEPVDVEAYDLNVQNQVTDSGGTPILGASVASGSVTLSSGTATIDTGVGVGTTATFYVALGPDTDGADVAADIRAASGGNYEVDIQETDTSVGNPTINYDVVRVR